MIDGQIRLEAGGSRIAPHLIQLKYAWGQTSDEFDSSLKRLQNELLVVAIDHINDNRFGTLGAVKIKTRADILTDNLTMSVGFDEDGLKYAEQIEIPVEIYAKLLPGYNAAPERQPMEVEVNVTANFPNGSTRQSTLRFVPEKRKHLTVGRIKECDLYLEHDSVSKHHASLVMSIEGVLKVADIGSTNGTFLHGGRITYGKSYEIVKDETEVGFGDVKTKFQWEMPQPEPEIIAEAEAEPTTLINGDAPEQQQQNPTIETETIESGGIKIGIKSGRRQQAEEQTDEPATHLNTKVGESDEPPTFVGNAEPETHFGNTDAAKNTDEPPTVFGKSAAEQNSDEPQTVQNKPIPTPAKLDEVTKVLKTNKLEPIESNADVQTDFGQQLETNPLTPDLLNAANDQMKETAQLNDQLQKTAQLVDKSENLPD